jgi:hypothetical protein
VLAPNSPHTANEDHLAGFSPLILAQLNSHIADFSRKQSPYREKRSTGLLIV